MEYLIPLPELLAGLAEECSELAQAALKYRRKITGTNPTPITLSAALDKLIEETADVELYLDQLQMEEVREVINAYKAVKLKRWKKRLKARDENDDSEGVFSECSSCGKEDKSSCCQTESL